MPAIVKIGSPISCGDTMAQGSGNVFANGIPVSRLGVDLTAGHCYPPVPIIAASPNVFTNGLAQDRVGDPIAVHCCGDNCHIGVAAVGSPNVFVNDPGNPLPPPTQQIFQVVDVYRQPNIPRVRAAVQHNDDQGSDPIYRTYEAVAIQEANEQPVEEKVVEEDTEQPDAPPVEVPTDCSDIQSHQGPFPKDFQLSPNFVLAQLTTNTLISNYTLRAQVGLTEKDIVCNLRILCLNVLEPMLTQYGNSLRINSAFRHGNSTSQHYRGQAADVSFTNLRTTEEYWDRAKEIKDNFNYDQFIYEQNRSIWYHLSFTSTTNRRQLLTKPRGNTFLSGLKRIQVA